MTHNIDNMSLCKNGCYCFTYTVRETNCCGKCGVYKGDWKD